MKNKILFINALFLILLILSQKINSQPLPIGKDWGTVGAKWHYIAGDQKRAKDSLVIVWESIADTTIKGINGHLFVKYYVNQKDNKVTNNIDSVIMYNSVTGDTFFRWLTRLKGWYIEYAKYINDKDTIYLEAKSTPININYLQNQVYLKFKNYPYKFGKNNYTTNKYLISDLYAPPLITINGIASMNFFKIEEVIESYYSNSYSEKTGNIICYLPNKSQKIIVRDSTIGCLEVIYLKSENINSLLKSITIFPNPSKGIISIESSSLTKGNLQILNLFGKIVYNSEIISESTTIDLGFLPKGVYLVEIINKYSYEKLHSKLIIE